MGINANVVARKTGVSSTMIYYISTGARGIGKATALRLSAASRRSAWWWLTATPEQIEIEFKKLSKGGGNGRARAAAAN